MSDNRLNWTYLILVILIPLLAVHLIHPSTNARLFSLLWVSTIVPLFLTALVIRSKQSVRLRNYSNPRVERRLTAAIKAFACILILGFVWTFTVPIWSGTYKAYVLHEPLVAIQDTIAKVGSTVLTPGLYWSIHTTTDQSTAYAYLFPTIYRFGTDRYLIMLLPGTIA